VASPDGGWVACLTNNLSDDVDPAWSSDSKRIAFSSNRDGNWEVHVMNADGSKQTNLTNNAARDEYPTWSPR
jgi:TolB protein